MPKDPADRDRVFVTRCGARFIRFEDGRRTDAVHRIFAQLLRDLGIKRKGVSFYSLRHSFRTACDGVDDRAAGVIMGHTPRENDMPTNYVHQVDDTRIEGVVRHVHEWLFGKDGPLFPVTAHLEEDEWRYAFETGVRLADRGLDAVRPVESTVGFLTVQQVARLFGVKDAAVTGWRKAGLLKMVSIAGANAKKPRWLVSRADLEEFQAKRQPVASEPPPQRRKRANRDPDFIEYY